MSIKFSPNGVLDITSDPADLPQSVDAKNITSGALTRCTNLNLNEAGKASTRAGNSKVSSTALSTQVHKIVEQNGDRYIFASTILYLNESSIETGLADADTDAIKYNPYNTDTDTIFFLNGTDRLKVEGSDVYEWGIDAPSDDYAEDVGDVYTFDWEYDNDHTDEAAQKVTQTYGDYEMFHNWEKYLSQQNDETIPDDQFESKICFVHEGIRTDLSAEVGVTGWIGVRFTYARYDGSTLIAESNPSDAIIFKSTTAPVITWDLSSDSQVTHVRIYRTVSGGATYYYHSAVEVERQQEVLYLEDTALGTSLETDHDRPPLGSLAFGPTFNGQAFIAIDNLLYYCKPKQVEYWPATYYVEISNPQDPVKAGAFYNGQLYVATAQEIYQVQGTNYDVYLPLPMDAATGVVNSLCFVSIKGQGILHLGNDGLYLFNGVVDTNITNDRFRPLFHGESRGGIPELNKTYITNCWMLQFRSKVYFAYPGDTDQYPKDMLVMDFDTQKTVYYQYAQAMVRGVVDEENERILAVDSDGYVRVLEDETATDDDGTDISWEIRSKSFDNLKRFFPRSARYDIDGTATGKVFLDDMVHQEHTISSRSNRKRLVSGGNGVRLAVGATGTGAVDIYEIEVE